MIYYKTKEEIELIKRSCQLVSKVHQELAKHIKPGITTLSLDKIAEEFIRDHGAIPGFKNYRGFPYTLCISVNEEVVHGFPSNRLVKEGDLLSIDCGAIANGFYGDQAYTYAINPVLEAHSMLLSVTKKCLVLGIEQAIPGNRIGHISEAVQTLAEEHGYGVVEQLVGHGLGRNLHEEPEVPNFGKKNSGPVIKEGLVIAIEPMINLGTKNIVWDKKDGWTVRSKDGTVSAHYEHTIAVGKEGPIVLTTFEYVEQELKNNSNVSVIK